MVLPDNLIDQKFTAQPGIPVLDPIPSPEVPIPHPDQLSPTNPSPAFPPTPHPKPPIIKSTLLTYRQVIPLWRFVSPSLFLPYFSLANTSRRIGLAASLSYGAASELIRRTSVSGFESSTQPDAPVIMTEANIKRLVGKLSQMRGAALKLGQFLSIQGMLRIYILYIKKKRGIDFWN